MLRTSAEWLYWGKRDPLWAVMSYAGRDRNGANPWTPEDFLAHGNQEFEDILRHWDHYGRKSGGTCVEIGCGSGRMTAALVATFSSVFAIDVSPDQIRVARGLLGSNAARVEFSLVSEPEIRRPAASCSAMFSSHVFQHLPGLKAIEAYLKETWRVLEPGATVCFHIPVRGAQRPERPAWVQVAQVVRAAIKRRIGRLTIMEFHEYSISEIVDILRQTGFAKIEFRTFPLTTSGLLHSHFFATKS